MAEKVLSCFIDESGDFGPYDNHAPYYIVAIVLHDQSIDIADCIAAEETYVSNLGFPHHALHTGPLIRRETDYIHLNMEERRRLFGALYNFARRLPYQYFCVKVNKAECKDDVIQLTAKLTKALAGELRKKEAFFSSFDKINIYYDNGQVELTKIITTVFSLLYSNVDIRRVRPVDYKLFQVADLMCTLELLNGKAAANSFTKSEKEFFGTPSQYKKEYVRKLEKKRI